MNDEQQASSVEFQLKVLAPEATDLPPAVFSNFVFVNRQDDDVMLVFTHAHGPIGPNISHAEVERLKTEGMRPIVVSAVVLPSQVVRGLVAALTRVLPDGPAAAEMER